MFVVRERKLKGFLHELKEGLEAQLLIIVQRI